MKMPALCVYQNAGYEFEKCHVTEMKGKILCK